MKKVYTIKKIESLADSKLIAHVGIDAEHIVFDGHFPEKPILPGVIELELIKSVVSQFFQKKFQLTYIKNAKYLGMILPDEVQEFMLEIDYKEIDEGLNVKALVYHQSSKYLKFSGNFKTNE